MEHMHKFYGELAGVRIARKHMGWYCQLLPDGQELKSMFNQVDTAARQHEILGQYVNRYAEQETGLAA